MATITANKNARTLQASASNSVSGTTTSASALDLTTRFGGLATLTITNGGTGPTVACDAILEVSRDNSNWSEFSRQTASAANSAISVFQVIVPESVLYLRSKFTGNTGQAVTVEATFQELTSYTSS